MLSLCRNGNVSQTMSAFAVMNAHTNPLPGMARPALLLSSQEANSASLIEELGLERGERMHRQKIISNLKIRREVSFRAKHLGRVQEALALVRERLLARLVVRHGLQVSRRKRLPGTD